MGQLVKTVSSNSLTGGTGDRFCLGAKLGPIGHWLYLEKKEKKNLWSTNQNLMHA